MDPRPRREDPVKEFYLISPPLAWGSGNKTAFNSNFSWIYSWIFLQSFSNTPSFWVSDWLLLVNVISDWLFYQLLELSWTCLCLGFLLLNFSSCSFDAFPVTCVSGHVCFWSHALPEHDCPLGNSHMIFCWYFAAILLGWLEVIVLG